MYGDYDRLATEADLRVNVGIAGTFLACVLAVQVHPLWLLLITPMAFLAYRGVMKLRQANDLLIQAIVTDLVKSPTFEEFIENLSASRTMSDRSDPRYR
jgi:hypothetical protein